MFPKYSEIEVPLLVELVRRGGRAKPSDLDRSNRTIYEVLADHFGLSEEARKAKIKEKNRFRSEWENKVRWARNTLLKKKLIDAPSEWGVWVISDKGKDFLDTRNSEQAGCGVFVASTKISPEHLQQLQHRAQQIGNFGEDFVLEHERNTLREAGRDDLAEAVEYTAKTDVSAGYDILSFSIDGTKKYIEVKTTVTTYQTFEITLNEWEKAKEYGSQYWIYRVCNAEASSPTINKLQDPFALHLEGKLILRPTTFQVIPSESI